MKYSPFSIRLVLIVIFMYLPLLATAETGMKKNYPSSERPLRVGVVGLVHTHVHWILGREDRGDIEIVGIVEPNRELAKRYSEQHGYSMDIVYDSIEAMVDAVQPEAVTAFNSIYDHLEVVQYCAPRGIHVMVEKPLAVSLEHSREMLKIARKHGIHLLTNYETSWYGSTQDAYNILNKQAKIGDLKRLVFNTGHPGPIEIGCNPEFLEWLTDPVLNGGGALTDFGCYGANIATWMLKGETPQSVTCITQQLKPHLYPKVEDEVTIILTYKNTQVIIQASWNWSHNRKDMEIYGTSGYIICKNARDMVIQESEADGPYTAVAPPLPEHLNDPFTLLQQVVSGEYTLQPFEVSSMENNEIVMQILEASKESSRTGKTVIWKDYFKN